MPGSEQALNKPCLGVLVQSLLPQQRDEWILLSCLCPPIYYPRGYLPEVSVCSEGRGTVAKGQQLVDEFPSFLTPVEPP